MAYTFKHGQRPIDGIEIQRAIGRGGFGEVYYALTDSGKQVALKYLRDNAEIELRGVAHVMNLKSPHLITIYDVRRTPEGEPFVIMEYVSGPSLRDLMNSSPQGLGPEKAAYFLDGIARGLSYLHDRGIVHRDLKPGNIFFDDGYVKIGDYGLSKHMAVSQHSGQTVSVGTVHYMAPEIGTGQYTRAIDIYALGVMLYEMLTGRLPFSGASMGEILMRHLSDHPDLSGVPEPFASVIARALQKAPADRYQNVNEMADAILRHVDISRCMTSFDPRSVARMPSGAMDPERTLTRSPVRPPPLDIRIDNPGVSDSAIPAIPPLPGEPSPAEVRRHRRLHERLERHARRARAWGEAGGDPRRLTSPAAAAGGFWPQLFTAGFAMAAVAMAAAWLMNPRDVGEAFPSPLLYLLGGVAGPLLAHFLVLSRNPKRNGWVDRIVYAGAGGLAMLPAMIYSHEELGRLEMDRAILPMMAVLAICDWNRRIEQGRLSGVSFSSFWVPAVIGLIAFGPAGVRVNPFVLAGLTGSLGLLIPYVASLWPRSLEPSARGRGMSVAFQFRVPNAAGASPPPVPPVPPVATSDVSPPAPTAPHQPPIAGAPAGWQPPMETAQPSFVGRTANAGLSLLGKLLLLGGLVLGLGMFSQLRAVRVSESAEVSFADGSVRVATGGAEGRVFRVSMLPIFGAMLAGLILLTLARRSDGAAHVVRGVAGSVLAIICLAVLIGPPGASIRALASTDIDQLSPSQMKDVAQFGALAGLSVLLLAWPRASRQKRIVL